MRMWRNGSASPCHGEGPGPIPGIRSQALVAECRRAGPRNRCSGRGVRVQVPPSVRKVNRTGVPGSPAKRCAGNTVGFDCSTFLAWEMKSLGGDPRLESGWGPKGPGIRLLRLPPWRVNPSGDGRRPESGRARKRWDSSSLLSSMEGAPPARERALKVRGGREAAGLDTSTFRWPRPSWSTGPA